MVQKKDKNKIENDLDTESSKDNMGLTSNTKREPEIQETNNKDWIDYDTLNSVEKEALERKIKKQVLNENDAEWRDASCCFSFCGWLGEQFSFNLGTSPPPSVYFSSLEFLNENSDTPQLFTGVGDNRLTDTYYQAIKNDVEIDYNHPGLDKTALGYATLKYTGDYIGFFDKNIYSKIADTYRKQLCEGKEFIAERLPFIIFNRDVFLEIADLLVNMKIRDPGEINTAKVAWAKAIIRAEHEKPDTGLDILLKMDVLDDMLTVDWYRVPIYFFNKRPH